MTITQSPSLISAQKTSKNLSLASRKHVTARLTSIGSRQVASKEVSLHELATKEAHQMEQEKEM